MSAKAIIAPSMLSSDFARLGEQAKEVLDAGADWLHMDVMDGHFVNNITIGAPVIKSLRKHTTAYLDCHLMVEEPEKWVEDFGKAGASGFTFHIEVAKDPRKLIADIKKAGMKPAIAIKPKTPLDAVIPLLTENDDVFMVLIMTVEPGFGGQEFMAEMMPKVEQLRKLKPTLNIQVDGGLSPKTIDVAAKAGANVIVAGSAIFGFPGKFKEIIQTLRDSVNSNQ